METKKGLTGNGLKLIAIFTMLIDHIGYIIVERGILSHPTSSAQINFYSIVDIVMRSIGRIAFVIFLFLLVEGFMHTSNVLKYALRLLIFALVSEIPFNIAVNGTVFYPEYQSVYFTLFLSLVMMYLYEIIIEKFYKEKKWLCITLCILVFLVMTYISHKINCDYSTLGIAMAAGMYFFRNKPSIRPWALFGIIAFYTIFPDILAQIPFLERYQYWFGGSSVLELIGVAAFILLRKYNGERGSFNLKYVFYLFYPVHLLILGLIEAFMFAGGNVPIK